MVVDYWTNDGGDYDATVLDTVTFYKDDYNRWQEFDVTSSAQAMVNGTKSNYGWIIKWNYDWGGGVDAGALFYSSDYTTDVTKRPFLEVTYQVDPLVSFDYDALNRVTKTTFANGVEETNQYDTNRGWLTRRDYKRDGTNIYYFNSTGTNDFDKAGNLKHVEYKHKSDAAETMDYIYNHLYRITQFKHNGSVSRNYDYDPNGNLITLTGKTLSYENDNNQLTGDGSRTFHFDAAGRVDAINTIPLSYDFRGNLVDHAYGQYTYTYDALGQRIRKTESGASKYYVTSGQQVLAEYSANSEPDAEYIHAPGRMIAKYDPDQGYLWFYVDHLNSTRLMDGSDQGQTDMRRDYYPYGEAYTAAGNDQTPYQFTQKELDNVTGFYYFGARYYDPSIGRWIVPDPARQYFSPYVYAGNSPVMYVDEDGEFAFLIMGALVGGYFGYQVGKAKGASGFDLVLYTLGGAAIGAASGGLGYVAGTAAGGGIMGGAVGGMAGGASQGFGMGHLAGMHGSNVWDATWKGGLSGLLGGGIGAGIGGRLGAFSGGFTAGATGMALIGGNLEQSIQAGLIGGGLGLTSYELEAAIRYSREIGDPVFDNYKNRDALSKAAQESFRYTREEGGWLRSNNDPQRWPSGQKASIRPTTKPIDANGVFHTHPNQGKGWVLHHSSADINFTNNYARVNHYVISKPTIFVQAPNLLPVVIGSTNYYLMVNSYNLWYFRKQY